MLKYRLALFVLVLVAHIVQADEVRAFTVDQRESQYLYDAGIGLTDKTSWHNYVEVYSHYFKDIKDKKLKFLEIGIWSGGSLVMWENYFRNAEIYGIDTTLDYKTHPTTRAICLLADQSKPVDLLRVVQTCGGPFDIILDDGGHFMQQQITSFLTLFPHLKKGGIYVIEDLHTSYWSEYGGGGTRLNPESEGNTTISFLKGLIDDVNFVGASTGRASHRPDHRQDWDELQDRLDEYKTDILSIHFYDSLCVIIKR